MSTSNQMLKRIVVTALCWFTLSSSSSTTFPSFASAFTITTTATTTKTTAVFSSNDKGGESEEVKGTPETALDLFASEGWPPIKKDLDSLPIFCVANQQGKPIAYSITINEETFQVPFFYCDVQDAKDELAKAKKANPDLSDGMDLIPFPLGVAFELWAKDQAVLIPSAAAIAQAGAPPGTSPIGQQVPLFACMDIMQEIDGKASLPLFMVLEEANAAVEEAVGADTQGSTVDDFEVVSLSLNRAVELLATVPETPAFQFIPPKASLEHIDEYLSDA